MGELIEGPWGKGDGERDLVTDLKHPITISKLSFEGDRGTDTCPSWGHVRLFGSKNCLCGAPWKDPA